MERPPNRRILGSSSGALAYQFTRPPLNMAEHQIVELSDGIPDEVGNRTGRKAKAPLKEVIENAILDFLKGSPARIASSFFSPATSSTGKRKATSFPSKATRTTSRRLFRLPGFTINWPSARPGRKCSFWTFADSRLLKGWNGPAREN